jgi:hypothetical protein
MKNILDYFYNIKEWYQTTNNKKIACIRNYFDKNETLSVTILWICFVLGIPLIMLLAASAIMALIIGIPIFIPLDKYPQADHNYQDRGNFGNEIPFSVI